MKSNPYRTLSAEHAHRDFLESRGIVPEPKVKLSDDAAVLFDADLCMPYADEGVPPSSIHSGDGHTVARWAMLDSATHYTLNATLGGSGASIGVSAKRLGKSRSR